MRGIGIQVNKLENRTLKKKGLIENFISNMKSNPKQNPISSNKNIVDNKTTLLETTDSKSHQSSAVDIHHTETISLDNDIKTKTVNFFEPKGDNSNFEKQPSTTSDSSHERQSIIDIKMSQVDPEFLSALPTDLRLEIENELKANEHRQNTESLNNRSSMTTMEITMTEESSKLYQNVHVDQMKEFIEEWVVTENKPKTCDIIMVSQYLCNLIKDSKTEETYEIIRKLYR